MRHFDPIKAAPIQEIGAMERGLKGPFFRLVKEIYKCNEYIPLGINMSTIQWNGLSLLVSRPSDRHIFEEILGSQNVYQLHRLIRQCKAKDVIIDLGGHIGLFSLAMCRHVSHVYAVEPAQENIAIFQSHLSRNQINNVTLIPKAIGTSNGAAPFYISHITHARHSFFPHYFFNFHGLSATKTEVETLSLVSLFDHYHIKKCNLLKMDIEGAEYDLIYECPKRILDRIDSLIIQSHEPFLHHHSEDLLSYLSSLDFHCYSGNCIPFKIGDLSFFEKCLIATKDRSLLDALSSSS